MFASKDGADPTEAAELQKVHYKTDWHRYNLKRKVANLPPITAENFQERVTAQKKADDEKDVDTSCYCKACSKHFSSSNAYQNHVRSKKHFDQIAQQEKCLPETVQENNARNTEMNDAGAGTSGRLRKSSGSKKTDTGDGVSRDDEEMEEDDEEEWDDDALSPEECLFCHHSSDSLAKNIKHMTVEHGFFIPDIEYLVDLEGLISYLGEKVGALHQCLWCGGKSRLFPELKSVQQHMVDKGHCKMFHEGDAVLEYADFYDYRSSYPDYEKDVGADEDIDTAVVDHLDQSAYQLVLPSGATVGHRSLMLYYRQKLRADRRLTLSRDSSEVSRVISHYKSLGWTGTTGTAAVVKAKDVAYFQRQRAENWTKLGVNANRLQKHFRDQVFGTK
jgi:pre-60S factor REI1